LQGFLLICFQKHNRLTISQAPVQPNNQNSRRV
jgi:hypothetical protein